MFIIKDMCHHHSYKGAPLYLRLEFILRDISNTFSWLLMLRSLLIFMVSFDRYFFVIIYL
jgi:hypothetical protein